MNMVVLKNNYILFIFIFFSIHKIYAQNKNGQIKENELVTEMQIKALNSFLDSKSFRKKFKYFYHRRPKINYCNFNLNIKKNCLEQLDSVMLGIDTNDLNTVIPISFSYWSSNKILSMRKWCKKSNYYIVFTEPYENILSFFIIRETDLVEERIRKAYESNSFGKSYLYYSVLISEKGYKVLCEGGAIKD